MKHLHKNPEILRELEQERSKNDLIRRLSVELSKLSNLKQKLDNILEMLDESFRLKHTMLLLPDAAQKKLRVFASRGFSQEGLGAEIPVGQGVIGVVAYKKRKLRMTNISRQRKYLSTQVGEGLPSDAPAYTLPGLRHVESQVAIPLLANDELVAVLSAESADLNFFSGEDEAFLMTLSQLLAISIQNAIILDQLEDKVKERTAALEAQKLELQQLNASKDRLFSIIGHDLRSPAASLQNATDLIRYYKDKGDMQELSSVGEKISRAATNINFMLDSLLNWSITQTGDLRIQPERLDVMALLDEVLEVYREMAESKQIRIHISCKDKLYLNADRNSALTILRNVICNSVKFTPSGGEIIISAGEEDGHNLISIRDTGVGMEPRQVDNIFCLQKGRGSKGTANEKGLGLGMLLVREFIQLNGGRVDVSSESGRGTHIRLFFPSA